MGFSEWPYRVRASPRLPESRTRGRAERRSRLPAPLGHRREPAYRDRLPNEFQRKLHLPRRRSGRAGQPASDVIRGSVWIQDIAVRFIGRIVIRTVKDIEYFPAKLDVEPLRNSVNRVVLEQGEIEIAKTRSDGRVATRAPQEIGTCIGDTAERSASGDG